MSSSFVAYHHPCPDGVFSALAAHVAFSAKGEAPTFVPLTIYETEAERTAAIPTRFAGAATVYLLDFSGGPAFITALCAFVPRVVLLDHHKTAMEDAAALSPAPTNLTVVFDMLRSGASIARDHFALADALPGDQASSVLELVAYVEYNDLWRHKLPHSKEFAAGLGSLKLDYDASHSTAIFDTLLSLRATDLIKRGVAELSAQRELIERCLAQSFVISIPTGDAASPRVTMLAVVTDVPDLRSSMGNDLAMKSAARGFPAVGAVVYEEPGLTGSSQLYKVSLRSVGDCDTTGLSRRYGGGGHKNASSCVVSRADFLSWRALELEASAAHADIGLTPDGGLKWPLLFTPGPLSTSLTTKAAALRDYGSRDATFLETVKSIRSQLLGIGGASQASGYECVLMQGSGTFTVECVLGCAAPSGAGKLLIVENGAYGRRMATIARVHGTPHTVLAFNERGPIDVDTIVSAVSDDASITHVAVVHHETTAGVLNPIHALGVALAGLAGRGIVFIVDSMSAFGAYPVDLAASRIHFLVSSANKVRVSVVVLSCGAPGVL